MVDELIDKKNEGASEEEIRALEEAIGAHLPEEFKQVARQMNGCYFKTGNLNNEVRGAEADIHQLYSLREIEETTRDYLLGEEAVGGVPRIPYGAISIGSSSTGDQWLMVVAEGNHPFPRGSVLLFDHEKEEDPGPKNYLLKPLTRIADSFEEFWDKIQQASPLSEEELNLIQQSAEINAETFKNERITIAIAERAMLLWVIGFEQSATSANKVLEELGMYLRGLQEEAAQGDTPAHWKDAAILEQLIFKIYRDSQDNSGAVRDSVARLREALWTQEEIVREEGWQYGTALLYRGEEATAKTRKRLNEYNARYLNQLKRAAYDVV